MARARRPKVNIECLSLKFDSAMFGWPSYMEAKSKSGILSPSSSANRGAQNRLRI